MRKTHSQLFFAMFFTLLFLLIVGLCGCGGGGGGGGSNDASAVKTLASIAIQPVNNRMAVGKTQPFTAIGTNTDSTTQDLTTQVTWSSSDISKATIDSGGKVIAVAPGPTTITATLAGVPPNTTTLTVAPPPPTGLGGVSGSPDPNVAPATITGKWEGTYTIYDAVDPSQIGTYTFKLDLTQSGTSVAGTSSLRSGTSGQADGQFTEGTATGRQIDFIFTYVKSTREMVDVGTATITDTTMTGDVIENYSGGYNCSYIFSLKKL